MLAKRRQSGSTTVTADDTESAADAPTPTGNERRSSPATSARRHRPRTTHLPGATASSRVAAAASRRRLHAVGRSATTTRPVRTSPPSSPETEVPLQPQAAGAPAGGEAGTAAAAAATAAAAVPGKTQFKYQRVKDSVRHPPKRGHVRLAGRNSEARQEGIFD